MVSGEHAGRMSNGGTGDLPPKDAFVLRGIAGGRPDTGSDSPAGQPDR